MSQKRAQKSARRKSRKEAKKPVVHETLSKSLLQIESIIRENEKYFTKMLPEVIEIDKQIEETGELALLSIEETTNFRAQAAQRKESLDNLVKQFNTLRKRYNETKESMTGQMRQFALDTIVAEMEELVARTTEDFLQKSVSQEDIVALLNKRRAELNSVHTLPVNS